MIDRVPPQNIEAEQAVLGAMLLTKEAISSAAEVLKADDFYREAHRIVFEAMMDLFSRGEAVDLITVTEQLKKNNLLEKAGVAVVPGTCFGPRGEGYVRFCYLREESMLREACEKMKQALAK